MDRSPNYSTSSVYHSLVGEDDEFADDQIVLYEMRRVKMQELFLDSLIPINNSLDNSIELARQIHENSNEMIEFSNNSFSRFQFIEDLRKISLELYKDYSNGLYNNRFRKSIEAEMTKQKKVESLIDESVINSLKCSPILSTKFCDSLEQYNSIIPIPPNELAQGRILNWIRDLINRPSADFDFDDPNCQQLLSYINSSSEYRPKLVEIILSTRAPFFLQSIKANAEKISKTATIEKIMSDLLALTHECLLSERELLGNLVPIRNDYINKGFYKNLISKYVDQNEIGILYSQFVGCKLSFEDDILKLETIILTILYYKDVLLSSLLSSDTCSFINSTLVKIHEECLHRMEQVVDEMFHERIESGLDLLKEDYLYILRQLVELPRRFPPSNDPERSLNPIISTFVNSMLELCRESQKNCPKKDKDVYMVNSLLQLYESVERSCCSQLIERIKSEIERSCESAGLVMFEHFLSLVGYEGFNQRDLKSIDASKLQEVLWDIINYLKNSKEESFEHHISVCRSVSLKHKIQNIAKNHLRDLYQNIQNLVSDAGSSVTLSYPSAPEVAFLAELLGE